MKIAELNLWEKQYIYCVYIVKIQFPHFNSMIYFCGPYLFCFTLSVAVGVFLSPMGIVCFKHE